MRSRLSGQAPGAGGTVSGAPVVAIDAMGGDFAPQAMVDGALRAVADGFSVVLVGSPADLEPHLGGVSIPIVPASDAIGMDESPTVVRRRRDSSVVKAIAAVAEGRADAAVSFGNTGAALVAGVLELGTLKGVERPALATPLPRSDGGRVVLLDVGANVDCRPEHLANFALLGASWARTLGVPEPRVGLLSNGHEDGKGNAATRAALPLLRALPVTCVGNIEPIEALSGGCDVLVCDGFVGNVLIKSVEAAGGTVLGLVRLEAEQHATSRFAAWLLSRTSRRLRAKVAWDAHGGAVLLGVDGVVVVGHGRANADAVYAAIRMAYEAVAGGLVESLRTQLSLSNDLAAR